MMLSRNLARLSSFPSCTRSLSSRIISSTSAYLAPSISGNPATSTSPSLSPDQRQVLDSAIRVDQAGEVAANYIYQGQMFILGKDPATRPILQEMWDQEKKHLTVMNLLQVQHGVRPTALWEVAKVAGWGLGAVTALMGKEAAMACTEAVETVIGEHYDDQLKDFDRLPSHPSIDLLKGVVRELRDDELEHLDTAVGQHSQRAPQHALLTAVVEAGCKIAVEVCKRV
ncbi:hypothetical protein BOTBODRAFT_155199 [Botryobasidium botryosum FD-172 SS1]|uniref:5-demethoxyubiquinone hydroxylase, mitochondrial n=1 Tax=Botryobasidium botryosum (strain FD-172 SS1) TaxID=930990 RepID=A0A067MTT5_BOTB1|nr:hypothetical protein BOTBODRAFT_155199 [Botryobasidium botryosum FD-172 SS1]